MTLQLGKPKEPFASIKERLHPLVVQAMKASAR